MGKALTVGQKASFQVHSLGGFFCAQIRLIISLPSRKKHLIQIIQVFATSYAPDGRNSL